MANFDVLCREADGYWPGDVIDESRSLIGNVEHLYLMNLSPGRYALEVTTDKTWDYALAWDSLFVSTLAVDFDYDFDVDEKNLGYLQDCATRSHVPQQLPACQDADMDRDGDVDQADFSSFQRCMSGAGITFDGKCATP